MAFRRFRMWVRNKMRLYSARNTIYECHRSSVDKQQARQRANERHHQQRLDLAKKLRQGRGGDDDD